MIYLIFYGTAQVTTTKLVIEPLIAVTVAEPSALKVKTVVTIPFTVVSALEERVPKVVRKATGVKLGTGFPFASFTVTVIAEEPVALVTKLGIACMVIELGAPDAFTVIVTLSYAVLPLESVTVSTTV